MNRNLIYGGSLAAAAAALLMATASAAELPSTSFNHQYNGDTYPLPGYTEAVPDTNTWITAPSTDGDIFTYQTDILAGGGYWQSDEWAGALNPITDATGWTMEFRIHILNDAEDDPTFGAFQVFAKDGGSATTSRRVILQIGRSFVRLASRGVVIDTTENTNDYHVFRISQPPSSSSITVWRDGVQLYNGLSRTSNNSEGSQLYWGDGSSGVGGPTVKLDYFRFDSTGPYEPVVAAPGVVASPQNTTNAVSDSVTLTAVFTNAITAVQWYKDDFPIDGATSFSLVSTGQLSTYSIPSVQPSDEGSYYCQGSNTAGSTNTATAYLDVLADSTPPTVASNSVSAWAARVRIYYSEPMDAVSAGEPSNYVFQGGALTVASVTVRSPSSVDVFSTERPLPGLNYVLEISNVQDTSGNPIAANTPVAFMVDTNFIARTNLLMAFNESSAMDNAGGGVAWRDLSGNENHAINPTSTGPTLVPDGLQGHDVFQFTPASTTPRLRLLGADGTGLTETSYTWFVVARCTNRGTGGSSSLTPVSPMVFNYYSSYEPANWNCYFYNGGVETTNELGEVEQGVVFAGRDDPGDSEVAAIPHPVPGDAWYILVGHVDTANGAYGRVVNPLANTVVAATNTMNPLGLGFGIPTGIWFGANSGGGNRFGGDMAEVLIYTGTLTQSELDSIEAYLTVKYFPPLINVQQNGANLEVHFTGVLQSSTNALTNYTDVSGNPPSPYIITPGNQQPQQYFRARYP